MYAIFVTGGKQYRAAEGDTIYVEKLDGEAGQTVVFDQVLLAGDKVGTPLVDGAKVTGTIEKQGRGKKLLFSSIKQRRITTKTRSSSILHKSSYQHY